MRRSVWALLVALTLAGCAADREADDYTAYSDSDFRTWAGAGPAALSGQVAYRLADGRTLTCAGGSVMLLPASGYNLDAEESFAAGKGFPANYDRNAYKFVRETPCDGGGRFKFDGLPAQNWIVLARVTWQESAPSYEFWKIDDTQKSGYLFREILLDAGSNAVVLSNREFVEDRN
jgi:hypothetical protein